MITTNRYDKLMDRQKKLRNKVERITNKAEREIKELNIRINKIRYLKNVRCDALNNKLTDTISLTENEVARIYRENKDYLRTISE